MSGVRDGSATTPRWWPYQYVVLRCVPRVDREEFLNVGVVVHCPDRGFLAARHHLDLDRLRGLDPGLDLDRLAAGLQAVDDVCRGAAHTAFGTTRRATAYGTREAVDDHGTRFGFLKAPRSTVLQPGPVHGGRTGDPEGTLEELVRRLVR